MVHIYKLSRIIGIGFGIGINFEDGQPVSIPIPIAIPTPIVSRPGLLRIGILLIETHDLTTEHI